ncbi:pentapeptide repeat-containing protein [Actinomadura sp. 6N118]
MSQLCGATFSGATFSGAAFSGAAFSGACPATPGGGPSSGRGRCP